MKSLIVIAALMFAGSAFAGEYTHYSRVEFQSASTWVPSNKVCQQDGNLYHKTKDAIAAEYCNSDSGTDCEVVYTPLVQPIESVRQRCAKATSEECLSYETVPFVQSTYSVSVYDNYKAWDKGSTPKSTRYYAFPACKKAPEVIAK